MKRIYKYLQKQFLYLGSFINWFLLLITRENFKCYISNDKKNKELRILCNGPSLDIENAFIIDNNIEYCMVNHACQTTEFTKVRPTIYIIADPSFLRNITNEAVRKSWNILKNVDWDMTLFVPFYLYEETKKLVKDSKLKICCYHSAPLNSWKKFTFTMYNKNLGMPFVGNVMIATIYVGIQKGFSKIRLYGSDHSWTEQLRVNENNQVCIRDVHYYDKNSPKLIPWVDETGNPYSMKIILKKFSEIFEQYEILERYAESKGVSILNMCTQSYIDAFKKECSIK